MQQASTSTTAYGTDFMTHSGSTGMTNHAANAVNASQTTTTKIVMVLNIANVTNKLHMNNQRYTIIKDCPNIGKEPGDLYNNEYGTDYQKLIDKGIIEPQFVKCYKCATDGGL